MLYLRVNISYELIIRAARSYFMSIHVNYCKFRLTNDTKCQFLRCMWLIRVYFAIKKAFLSEKGFKEAR